MELHMPLPRALYYTTIMAELPLFILPVCLLTKTSAERRLITKGLELSKLLCTTIFVLYFVQQFFKYLHTVTYGVFPSTPREIPFGLSKQFQIFKRKRSIFTQGSERFTCKHSLSLSFSLHCKYSFKSVCFVTPTFAFDFLQKKNDKGSMVLSIKHQTMNQWY